MTDKRFLKHRLLLTYRVNFTGTLYLADRLHLVDILLNIYLYYTWILYWEGFILNTKCKRDLTLQNLTLKNQSKAPYIQITFLLTISSHHTSPPTITHLNKTSQLKSHQIFCFDWPDDKIPSITLQPQQRYGFP